MRQFTLVTFFLLMVAPCRTNAQYPAMGDLEIIPDVQYMVTEFYNILANMTSKSMTSIVECTQQCLQYPLCETATYYFQTQTCSLTRERYGLGQLINVATQIASVAILNYRVPAVTYSTYDQQDIVLTVNQFIYSPNRLFAFGLTNSKYGVYHTDANGNIASQFHLLPNSVSAGCHFRAQFDGNLVLYSAGGSSLAASWTQVGVSAGPFTLNLLNTGELVWLNHMNAIVWNSSSGTIH